MSAFAAAALIAGAYLLGSISFSYLIVRALQGRDVRALGSGNAGATNVLRAAGKLPGVATLLLDIAKGAAAVLAARALAAPPPVVALCAAAVVLGHVFPLFLGFRGGKGVATAAGAMGALAPLAIVPTFLLLVLVVAGSRYVSLGSIAATLAFPLFLLLGRAAGWIAADGWVLGAAAAVAALIVWKHRSNLARLRAGSEPRLGDRQAAMNEEAG
ncbi:MAG TPA: glycerol-3-phosphate 1-O-acyltransferase PlsY [Thermoanaerobaculia bacterium]|nr:glycerol-3-phosphate 1-O-acyltransferase PlsY [Thermoanaerobaculia bacterium]